MISFVVARGRNNVIGKNGQLLWHIKEDFAHFKNYTHQKTVIMGRKTFESIGKILPHRHNVILTKNKKFTAEGATIYHDIHDILQLKHHDKELCVIGGAEIYQIFYPYVEYLVISEVDFACDGDAYFPSFSLDDFEIEKKDSLMTGIPPVPSFQVCYYRRSSR